MYCVLDYVNDHNFEHFQYVGWPDHGAPKNTDTIIALAKALREIVAGENQDVTVLVHCSAGVGRTGTFISLYLLMETLDEKIVEYKKEKLASSLENYDRDKITIDVFNTVFNLRKQRCEMVNLDVWPS